MIKFLSRKDLEARGIAVSNQTLLRWESEGRFPKRVPSPGGQRVMWLAEEVDAHLATIVANRHQNSVTGPEDAIAAVRAKAEARRAAKAKKAASEEGGLQSSQE